MTTPEPADAVTILRKLLSIREEGGGQLTGLWKDARQALAALDERGSGEAERGLDAELKAALVARLSNWATEMRRSAKAMHDHGMSDVAVGNSRLADDLEAGVRELCATARKPASSGAVSREEIARAALEPFAIAHGQAQAFVQGTGYARSLPIGHVCTLDFERAYEAYRLLALPTPSAVVGESSSRAVPELSEGYQSRVGAWMFACFGDDITNDRTERAYRFLEEALELVQALGCTREEAMRLVDYTFARPVGELPQEIGGVMVCLAALCVATVEDLDACAEAELARVWTKIEKIRAKHAAKPKDVKSSLPGYASTSQTVPGTAREQEHKASEQMIAELCEALQQKTDALRQCRIIANREVQHLSGGSVPALKIADIAKRGLQAGGNIDRAALAKARGEAQ